MDIMYYVYILLLSDGTLYKGSSGNIKERFLHHTAGKVQSTKNKRPLKLIHVECYTVKSDALRREKFLKTTEGRRLLRQQIRDILQHHGCNEK